MPGGIYRSYNTYNTDSPPTRHHIELNRIMGLVMMSVFLLTESMYLRTLLDWVFIDPGIPSGIPNDNPSEEPTG